MENNDVSGAEKRRDAQGTSPACSPMFDRAQKWHIIVAAALELPLVNGRFVTVPIVASLSVHLIKSHQNSTMGTYP